MRFPGYYKESYKRDLSKRLSFYSNLNQKTLVWNTFVDSNLTGVTDDDFSIIPRVLPASYWPILKKTAYDITRFTLELLSLPEREIHAIVPTGPIRDFLLDELEVLRYRKGRITGSYRFDMAVVGPPIPSNPPKLLEINEIGFDGLARATYFQKVLLELMPDLRGRLKALDPAVAEVQNMQRLGSQLARIQYDSYNWDEEYLVQTAVKHGLDIQLISPSQYGFKKDKDFPLMKVEPLKIIKNRVQFGSECRPNATNLSFAFGLKDYHEGAKMYKSLVRSQTPQYGPFLTGLIATKTILVLLDDAGLRKKLLGKPSALKNAILPAHILSDPISQQKLHHPRNWVLKHTDGCGGEQVFMNRELERQLRKIRDRHRHEWVLQRKTQLNLIDVNGILSRPKQGISDLGVFVQFDWANGRFRHFEVGGLMCRATNKSLKVNVSSGGVQVAVFLDRAS